MYSSSTDAGQMLVFSVNMGKEYSFIGFPALHCLGGLSGSSTAPSGVSLNEVRSMPVLF